MSYSAKVSVSVCLAAAVLAAVWLPEFAHWHVNPELIDAPKIQIARTTPDRRVLDEIADMDLRAGVIDRKNVVADAEKIIAGILSLPGYPSEEIRLPLGGVHPDSGVLAWRLMVSSFVAVDIVLRAYEITRREEFFNQARSMVVAFAEFERTQWVNHELMWNEHAVGARIPVIVRFWAHYRQRPDFDPGTASLILGLVSRSARMLAEPSHYAWRTGHGTVQDLALLQIATAFPMFADSSRLRTFAVKRFNEHMDYYIPPEGVTLLHSAGYHGTGVHFFGVALRLLTLNGIPIPPEWWDRYSKALEFYAQLIRPDRTLPMYGDTRSTPDDPGPLVTERDGTGAAQPLAARPAWVRQRSFGIFPVSGHAIWWDMSPDGPGGSASQTTVTWSYHPGLGHKLADELSIVLWANGRTWLTNTGYWPYGVWGRRQAESWEGSNAPHLSGENAGSSRTSRALGLARSAHVTLLDTERTGPGDFVVRRQIARLPHLNTWIVLDHYKGTASQTATTTWTFFPDLAVTPTHEGGYRIAAKDKSTQIMHSSFCGFSEIALLRGSKAPFAGWVAADRGIMPAAAVVTRHLPKNSWSLATFTISDAGSDSGSVHRCVLGNVREPDEWTASVYTDAGGLEIKRKGDLLHLVSPGNPTSVVARIEAVPAPVAEIAAVRNAFATAARSNQRFVELISYRVRMTYLLLAAFVFQELLLLAIRRSLPRAVSRLRTASWVAWVVAGVWLSQVYFRVAS